MVEACIYCGAETKLYDNGRPVCVACADRLEAGKPPRKKEPESEGHSPGDTGAASAAKAC